MVDSTHRDTPPPSLGGSWGAFQTAERYSLADLRLVRRAIRERWPVPQDFRDTCVRLCTYLMEHGKDRAKIAAAKFFANIQSIEGN